MNTTTNNRHPAARWKSTVGLIVVFGSGCSFAAADSNPGDPPAPAPSPQVLYSVSELSASAVSVTLLPQQLHSAASFGETSELRLYVGAMGRFRSGVGTDPFNRLALVILAASDSIKPVLHQSRQLLLDIDGDFYKTHPIPDPRLYSFGPSRLGYTETVIVPIDLHLLTLLAGAESVRGRIGHWVSFSIPPEVVARLGDLLTALPEDFPSGHRRVAAIPLLRVTY